MNTCRVSGGPIPWDRILLYAQHEKFDEDLTKTFIEVIRQLDVAYIRWYKEEQEKKPHG